MRKIVESSLPVIYNCFWKDVKTLHKTMKLIMTILLSAAILSGCSSGTRQALASADLPDVTDSPVITYDRPTSATLPQSNETEATSEDMTQATTTASEETTTVSQTEESTTTTEQTTTAQTTTTAETTTQKVTTTVPTTVTTATTPQIIESEENRMNVIGYLTTWNYGCYKTLDWSNLTHINIAFVNPDTNGVFKNDMGSGLSNVVKTAHENGVKVLASLGGWGGSVNYPALVDDKATRDKLNENLIDFVKKYDLDGIDLDIEGDVDNSFWKYYEAWVDELRALCDDNELLLTTAVGKWYSQKISDHTFMQFDLVNMMIYDNTSDYNHASYEFALDNIDYYIDRGVDAEKLVIGVPFYARRPDFTYMSYKNIISASADNFNSDSYDEYTYNGKDTMLKKCELSKNYGGIMIWELGDDATGEYSLLSLIGDAVLK